MNRGRTKFAIGNPARVNDKAPGDYKGREGVITQRGPRKSEYQSRIPRG